MRLRGRDVTCTLGPGGWEQIITVVSIETTRRESQSEGGGDGIDAAADGGGDCGGDQGRGNG
jgi:hypothetical protein